MEVKPSCNVQNLGLFFSLYPSLIPNPSRPHSFCLKSWLRNQKSVKKHIKNLAGRWSFHVKELIKSRDFPGVLSEDTLVHVVKQGETLSSISKQYGVSILSIAAVNRDVVDLDLVYEGQHLRIPSFQGSTQKTENRSLLNHDPQQRHKWISTILDEISKQNNFTILVPPRLPYARATGYFLVLVPLIAICIRCINGAFYTRIAGYLGHQDANNSKRHPGFRSTRWKSALSDIRELDISDSDSVSDSDNSSPGDQAQVSAEDFSSGYKKLEKDYEKFLSQCGISNSGYWRGGSTE